jgi:hypothetical protein
MGVPHPYRTPARHEAPQPEPLDPVGAAIRLAGCFVLGWAFLRVAVCAIRGLDVEGAIALVVFIGTVASLTRSLS